MKRLTYTIIAFLMSIFTVRAKDVSMYDNLILLNSNDLDYDVTFAHASHASHASHMSQVFTTSREYQLRSDETNLIVNFLIKQECILKFLTYSQIQDFESLISHHSAKIVCLNSFGGHTLNKPIDCISVTINFLADPWVEYTPQHTHGWNYNRIINVYIPLSNTEDDIYIHYFEPFKGHEVVTKFVGIQDIIDSISKAFYEK